MAKKNWKMHFYKGSPCDWDGDEFDKEVDANKTYNLDLTFYSYSRGCSSAVIIFVPTDKMDLYEDGYYKKLHYNVFLSDLETIIKNCIKGRIKGTFRFVKKGQNYGLQLIEKEK